MFGVASIVRATSGKGNLDSVATETVSKVDAELGKKGQKKLSEPEKDKH